MQRHQKPKPKNPLRNLQPKPVPLQSTVDLSLIRTLQSSPTTPKDSNFEPTTSWYKTKKNKKTSPNYRPQHYSSKSQLTKKRRKLLAFFCFACSSTVRLVPRPEFFSPKLTKPRKPRNQKHLNMPPRDQISASMHQSWLHYKAQIPIQNQPRRELNTNSQQKLFFFLPDNKLLITVQKQG